MKKVENSTIHFGVPTWVLLGLQIVFPLLWFGLLQSFLRTNVFYTMGLLRYPILYFAIGAFFTFTFLVLLVVRLFRFYDFLRKDAVQRRIYAKLWGIPRGKLNGPIYVRVHSLDDFHNEESQKIYFYIDRKKNIAKLFFEVRVKNCYEGKECEVCEEKENDFFSNHKCIQRVVAHDEVFAEFDSVPSSFEKNALEKFLKINLISIKNSFGNLVLNKITTMTDKKSQEKGLPDLTGISESLGDLNRSNLPKKPNEGDQPEPEPNKLNDKANYLD
jgi:hypothetical protein